MLIAGLWKTRTQRLNVLLALCVINTTVFAFDPGSPLEGIDPLQDAVINSVYDRSLDRAYTRNLRVEAYSGEVGKPAYGVADSDCYGKEGNGAFVLDGNYRGAFGSDYLCYDGHPGVDFKADGDWVIAVDGGVVTAVVDYRSDNPDPDCGCLGNFIEISHPGGFKSRYGHLKGGNQILVSDGDSVSKGERIGVSGNSGASGGAHLHLEFWDPANKKVDPFDFWSVIPSYNHDGNWSERRLFPSVGYSESLSFTIAGKGYIGLTKSDSAEFWQYNPYTNRWTRKIDHPGITFQSPSFVIGNKAFVISGNTLWEYDPGNDTWTQKSDAPGESKRAGFGFSLNGKGYIGGGSFNNCEFWVYRPTSDTWTHLSDHPALGWAGNCSDGHDIGAVTFTDGSSAYVTGTNIYFWKYNPSAGWSKIGLVGDEWGGSTYSQAFSIGRDGFIFSTFGILYKYDTSTGKWTKNIGFPGQAICYAAGFSANGALYVGVGGEFYDNTCYLGEASPNIWRFVPD